VNFLATWVTNGMSGGLKTKIKTTIIWAYGFEQTGYLVRSLISLPCDYPLTVHNKRKRTRIIINFISLFALYSKIENFKVFTKIINITKKKFVRNIAIVASGTVGAQVVTIVFSPIITRLYGPEAFGLLGSFLALVGILSPIAALAYPIAIVLPKNDGDAKGIARLSFYISLAIALLVALVLIVGGDRLLALLSVQSISVVVLLMPLNLLFMAWTQIPTQWLIRKKQYSISAKIEVLQALILNSAKSGMGIFIPLAPVLIVLTTIGNASKMVHYFLGAKRAGGITKKEQQIHSQTTIIELAKRYNDFPFYRSPQLCINAMSTSLPVLMLTSFFGPTAAGFYVLGRRVLVMPVNLIGNAFYDVLYPRLNEGLHNNENLTQMIIKATLALAGIGILPFSIVVVFGPWLFSFVFGKEWIMAGEYARWLAPFLFFQFINRPSVAAIPVLGIQKGLMIYELFSTGIKLLALYIGFGIFANDTISVALFSIFGAIAYILLIVWVLMSSKKVVCEKIKRSSKKSRQVTLSI